MYNEFTFVTWTAFGKRKKVLCVRCWLLRCFIRFVWPSGSWWWNELQFRNTNLLFSGRNDGTRTKYWVLSFEYLFDQWWIYHSLSFKYLLCYRFATYMLLLFMPRTEIKSRDEIRKQKANTQDESSNAMKKVDKLLNISVICWFTLLALK